MSISKQLIHLRSVKGISQEDLASLMGVTRQAVSKWETDQAIPDSEKIVRLSEIFNVSTDYILKGKESDPLDLYSQHSSKAGARMSAEVNEKLDHVSEMSMRKRYIIGGCLFLFALLIVCALVYALS